MNHRFTLPKTMKMNVLCAGVLGRADGRLYRGVCSLPCILLGDEPSTAGQTLQEWPRGRTSALEPLRHELRLKFSVINETDHRLVQSWVRSSWYYLANYVVCDSDALSPRHGLTYSLAAKHLNIGGVGIWGRSRTNKILEQWYDNRKMYTLSHSYLLLNLYRSK